MLTGGEGLLGATAIMKFHIRQKWLAIAPITLAILTICSVDAQGALTFTTEQADIGEATYQQNCAKCHGATLDGTPFGPPLLGDSFIQRWAGRPLADLFSFAKATMPPGGTSIISDSNYAAIIAYVLEAYGLHPTTDPLPTDLIALNGVRAPNSELLRSNIISRNGGIAPGVALPTWPVRPPPDITSVDDEMLANPPDGSWLTWRRTQDASGFSPLRQISKSNIRQLRVAWTLALATGPNEATPLVHDGVMFVHSPGGRIQALDAATGDELWSYQSNIQVNIAWTRKNIAIFENKLYSSTIDSHVVALETKTGRVVWEWSPQDAEIAFLTAAGPTIADGVVVQGAASIPGGGLVVGLDANTGRQLWRFRTIAQPGELNGDSWNDLPAKDRSGGTVWLPGTYDSKRKLVLLGPAPTYDTLPLRNPVQKSGITNDALYTNTTIALHPKTGELAWFYQHFPNDQWDLDWAFERHLIDLSINGEIRRIVLTAGKQAVYDAIDADTGKHVFSMDLGLQNVILGIDRDNGTKLIDRNLTPGLKETVTVCPHSLGAKSWLPAAFNKESHVLYVPLVEACMDMVRVKRWGMLGGVRWTLRPPPGSDGKYGRLQAINLESRKFIWTARQRAPQTSGVLATAGGIVFAGALDRWFTAYDSDTGDTLWRIRLNDVPNSSPISYLANGKQYIAIVVGHGGYQSLAFLPLVPEIRLPATQSSVVWVFELPNSSD